MMKAFFIAILLLQASLAFSQDSKVIKSKTKSRKPAATQKIKKEIFALTTLTCRVEDDQFLIQAKVQPNGDVLASGAYENTTITELTFNKYDNSVRPSITVVSDGVGVSVTQESLVGEIGLGLTEAKLIKKSVGCDPQSLIAEDLPEHE